MARFKVILEYNGTNYEGWQTQASGKGVQDVVEHAIAQFAPEQPRVVAAGRTDTGVHAMGQVFHVDIQREMTAPKVCDAINAHLRQHPVAAISAEIVSDDFSARFDAKKRYYRYVILNRRAPAALLRGRVWQMPSRVNIAAMQEAAALLIGAHDFTSFRSSVCQAKNPKRTLDNFTITQHADQIWFECSARAFLHHQVRNMVGTLVEIGRGKRAISDIPKMLAAKDRAAAGLTAPACGLYFMKVDY